MATSRRWRSPLLPDTSTASKDMVGAAVGALGLSAVRSNPMAGVDEDGSAATGVDTAVPVSAGEVVAEASPESESDSESDSSGWEAVGFLPRGGLRVGFFFFFLDG